MAVAVVERFKELSMSWTVRGDEKKKTLVERWPLVEAQPF